MPSNDKPFGSEELAPLFAPLEGDLRRPCAIAVSGGSDSTALMVLLADWLACHNLERGSHVVLTVDHGLRPNSRDEAEAVRLAAEALGFRHQTLTWQEPKPASGIQAAARRARYELMAGCMQANAIGLLLTGHTRDDVAETMLMRLARGSGLDGLAAIAPRLNLSDLGIGVARAASGLQIARPLLDVPKARLRATLQARGVPWAEDPSNRSPAFERTRLRAARARLDELGLTDAMLALSASRLLRARHALEGEADRFCDPATGAVTVNPCGCFSLDRARLDMETEEIALRVLARVIAAAGGSNEHVPLGKLEAMLTAMRSAKSKDGSWTLARALIASTETAVVIEREPGREPLPRAELALGEDVLWDGRFWVSRDQQSAAGRVEVRPLGEAGVSELRQRQALPGQISARVAGLVPSFWHGQALLAAPSLGFRAAPEWGGLHALFNWTSAIRNRSMA